MIGSSFQPSGPSVELGCTAGVLVEVMVTGVSLAWFGTRVSSAWVGTLAVRTTVGRLDVARAVGWAVDMAADVGGMALLAVQAESSKKMAKEIKILKDIGSHQ